MIPAEGNPRLALILPAKDEAERLPAALNRIAAWCARTHFPLEVVVVDDGSDDGTATVAEAFKRRIPFLRVIRHALPRGGQDALRTGFAAAKAPIVAFSDAGLSAAMDRLPRLLAAITEGADVAVGSSRVEHGPNAPDQGLLRGLAGYILDRLGAVLSATQVHEAPDDFTVFRADAARAILRSSEVDGLAFDTGWPTLARGLRLRVIAVPVAERRGNRSSSRMEQTARQPLDESRRVGSGRAASPPSAVS